MWTNPASCWHIIPFKESKGSGGRNSSSTSLTFLLQTPIFYTERQADKIIDFTILLKKVAEGLVSNVRTEIGEVTGKSYKKICRQRALSMQNSSNKIAMQITT
jgi:hypothetical protein